MLRLSSVYRFPLKSCKAESMQRASFDALGLAGDRRWMLVDAGNGRFFTQRALPHMSQLSVLWNASGGVTLSAPGFRASGCRGSAGYRLEPAWCDRLA